MRETTGSRPVAPLVLAVVALLLGAAWAIRNRPFDAPDEPSHLNAIRQVIDSGRPPLAFFRFDRDPAGEIVSPPFDRAIERSARSFGVDGPMKLAAYESMQAPLYYVIAAGLCRSWSGNAVGFLIVARLVSVAFGSLCVVGIWRAVREIAPDESTWAWASAGTALLIPQFAFNAATAGNDAAVNAAFAWIFAAWARGLRDPRHDSRGIKAGAWVGLAILAKVSGLVLLPGLLLMAVFVGRPGGAWRRVLAGLLGLLFVSGWWLFRNAWILGDPTGSRDATRYYRARQETLRVGDFSHWKALADLTWQSFWGRFGWMNRPLPSSAYLALGVAVVGLLGLTVVMGWRRWPSRGAIRMLILMSVTIAGILAVFLQLNVSGGFQGQGRYLFPVLTPIVMALAFGASCSGPWHRARLAVLWAFWALLVGLNLVGLAASGS